MPKPFVDVTTRTQVERLRALAGAALPIWGLPDANLRLLNHGYNTTFEVRTTDGRRYALRVNTQPHKTEAQLRAEVAWLAALSAETDLRVPTPLPTLEGDLKATVFSPDHGRDLPVVVFGWLDGPNLGARPRVRQLRAVGAAAATLHQHARTWTMPSGAELPPFDNVLTDIPNRLGGHPALTREASELFTAAYHRAQALQDEAFVADRVIVLHADLHGENLKWHDGRLSVFDFDDAGTGVPSLDLAIAAYYLRDDQALEAAMWDGYADVAEPPKVTPEQFDGMVAGRNLLLVNDFIEQPNAAFRAMMPTFIENSMLRQRQWLQTGRWRRHVPGVRTL